MNFLRVKQARCALADGRLDEAHGLLSRDGVRSHRQGQRLATKLVKAYVNRGQSHLEAGRLYEALADCEKAGTLGGHQQAVAELRGSVTEQMKHKRNETEQRDLKLDAARQHAREGFLSKGVAMLRGAHGGSVRVEQAQQELDLHRAKADAALERGGAALDREDWAAAGHHIAEARRLRPFDRRVDELASRMTDEATGKVRDAMQRGRVDKAESLLRAVSPAAGDDLGVREMRDAVGQVALASRAMNEGDARSAGRGLRKVKALLPGADWVDEAIALADRIVESQDALEHGPLGLISDGYASQAHAQAATTPMNAQIKPTDAGVTTPIVYHHGMEDAGASHDVLPKQFLIQVDGAGSALASCQPVVTVGPVSSPQRPDVGLIADPDAPVVTLQRVEDDYFLRSPQAVKVNGKPTNDKLLNDGDKIELSPRCRFRFRLPHAASTTAVLEMTGSRLVRADVKRVVLLDRQLVIGAGAACHLRADSAEEPVVLNLRGGRLMLQSKQAVKVGAGGYDVKNGLPMNTLVNLGTVSLRVAQA